MARGLKIGDKVRHKTDNTEGVVAYSAFGLSINGYIYDEDNKPIHFKTLGMPKEVVESEWKRVYKWKYNMLKHEEEKQKRILGEL